MYRSFLILIICLVTSICLPGQKPVDTAPIPLSLEITLDTSTLHDVSRNRNIPIAVYTSKSTHASKHPKLVLLNHGYNVNRGGDYLRYSYIAKHLASEGFYVVSIQHELPTDSLMPTTGIPQIVRRSNWERGVVNILFVLNHFKKTHPELDYKQVTIIGHSNGGDMAMLFATQHPKLVAKVISLDNRRVALPRTRKPEIYSIRSTDQPADEGILPDTATQRTLGITIVKLPATIHNDMGDNGTEQQQKEINGYIDTFLKAQ
jgi:predicted dienelactone hydrolase